MRRSLAYLPTPYTASVTTPDGRGPRVVAVVDHQPVTLAAFDGAEAPAAFSVVEEATGRRRDYRIADGRLWAALGEDGGWTLDEAAERIVEGVGRRVSGGGAEADREQGFLDALVSGDGRGPVEDVVSLGDLMIDPPPDSAADARAALKHVENRFAVVDGRLHHEVPEPTLRMDVRDGGAVLDVSERRWEDVNGAGPVAYPAPPGRAWLTFPVHHGPLAVKVAAVLAESVGRRPGAVGGRRRVLFHDASVEASGVPGHVANGFKVARAESVLAAAAGMIGHATDEAVFAYVGLRRAVEDVGPDRSPAGLSGLDPAVVARLTASVRELYEALARWSRTGVAAEAHAAALTCAYRDRHEDAAPRAAS